MNIPYTSIEDMQAWARARMHRAPDFVIGDDPDAPYMKRWWIIPRNEWCNVYLHQILRSDDDRALHDHPWENTSFLIDGEYDEVFPVDGDNPLGSTITERRRAGDTIMRAATNSHRLILPEGGGPVASLFITGPKVRDWGFWCPQGWRHWKDFTGGVNGESVGRGCGE